MYHQLRKYITDRVAIGEEELNMVVSCFKCMKVKRKEHINVTGDVARRMYFVMKGCLRIYFIKPDCTEVTRRFAFENWFSTSLASFITGNLLTENTQAVEDSELLYISRNDFYHLLDTIPAWEKFYRGYLEYAYVTNTRRMQDFITLTAADRYKLLLEEHPEMVLRLPGKLVANYLNITQESLSRIKAQM